MEPLKVPTLPFSSKPVTSAQQTPSIIPTLACLPPPSPSCSSATTSLTSRSHIHQAQAPPSPPVKRLKTGTSQPWTTNIGLSNDTISSSSCISSSLTSSASAIVSSNAVNSCQQVQMPQGQQQQLYRPMVTGTPSPELNNLIIAENMKIEDASTAITTKNQAFNISNLATSSTCTSKRLLINTFDKDIVQTKFRSRPQ